MTEEEQRLRQYEVCIEGEQVSIMDMSIEELRHQLALMIDNIENLHKVQIFAFLEATVS